MKRIFTYLLTITSIITLAQELPKVQINADSLQIRPGEQVHLSVMAETDTLSFVDFPELSNIGDLEVVSTTSVDTLQAKPYRKLLKKYFLTQWDSGNYVMSPLQIKINDSTLLTDSLQIKVLPVAVDTTQQGLYGFKEPINIEGKPINELPDTWSAWWWLLLIPVLALAYYFYRKRQKDLAAKSVVTPYEKAQKALQNLKAQKLWLQHNVDAHYLGLTDTLKDYLEDELQLSAKEKISNELLQELKKYRFENGLYFNDDLLKRLQETLQRADLAKFAKLTPNPADIDLDFQVVKDVIDYAHQIVQKIADEKAEELAKIEADRKRRKRVTLIVVGGILFLVALLGGIGYYYLNKTKLIDNIQENIAAPEWVYNEYGSTPALGLTTPHILHHIDMSNVLDSMPAQSRQLLDEIAVYADQNLIKKYVILAASMDMEQKLPENTDFAKASLTGLLAQIKARDVNVQEADVDEGKRFFGNFTVDLPVIGNNLKVEFDSRFYPYATGQKFVIGMYLQGNKDNQALIERVLQSAELVQ